MPIVTDSYIEVKDNSDNLLDKIGLSKTLDNYSIDDLITFAYCSNTDKLVKDIRDGTYAGSDVTGVGFTQMNGGIPCLWTHVSNPNYWMLKTEKVENPTQNNLNGLYSVVVWLYGDNPSNSNPTFTALANLKLVTEWNAPHYLFDVSNASFYSTGAFGATNWTTPKSNSAWAISGNTSNITYHTDFTSENDVSYNLPSSAGGKIKPYLLFMLGSNIYIKSLLPVGNSENTSWKTAFTQFNSTANATCSKIYTDSDGLNAVGVNNAILDMYSDASMETLINFPYTVRTDNNGTNYGHDINGFKYTYLRQGTASPSRSVYISYFYSDVEDMKLYIANAGLHFKADKIYKPIINGGHVYSFSDVLTTPSELDEWHDSTNHGISPNPPSPTPPNANDNEIDVDMSQFAPSVGFVNYIEMDYETAQHVASAFNTYNASIWNVGGDLFKNLISYKIFAVYGIHSGTIKNIHIAGHELEYNDAPINGNYIDDMGVVDLGTIDVGSKFRFNDWRDFAPYTKIECFVPCCGWCQLPPWVMGRTVTGTMYIDIANGSCKAVIKAGKTPVAEIGGCVAVDVPFSSVATGAKAAGLITAITNGAVSAFNPTPQNLISGSFGILSALNANYTETKGVMGDGSNINGCTQFLIKVTRPASTDTTNGTITNTYKHTKGIPTNKTITLAKGDGFTQITDANITGNMTAREKQMIVDGFRHGLIL